jgi:predicted dinucleotide-binding enzyme
MPKTRPGAILGVRARILPDMVLLAVPLHSCASLPPSALDGRIVMDAGNYYTDWSGHIEELDD